MHFHRGACGTPLRPHASTHATINLKNAPGRILRPSRSNHKSGYLANRRQRLTTESKRFDPIEVVSGLEFTCGVRRNGKRQVIGSHPTTVVDHPHERRSSLLKRDINPRRPRIERIVKEFTKHTRRPLHHLPRGDAIHDRLRKTLNAAHGLLIPRVRRGRCNRVCLRKLKLFDFAVEGPLTDPQHAGGLLTIATGEFQCFCNENSLDFR